MKETYPNYEFLRINLVMNKTASINQNATNTYIKEGSIRMSTKGFY